MDSRSSDSAPWSALRRWHRSSDSNLLVGRDYQASSPVFAFSVWNTVDPRSNNALRPGCARRTQEGDLA